MGINSTEVSYGFGQFGSAFADANANVITPPEELAIVAIQFLDDTSLDTLTSSDANVFPTIGAAAHDNGHYTRTVDGATSSSTKVIFDQENAGTGNNDNIEVGDEIYLTSTGASLGVVAGLNPDDDNTKEISVASQSISDGVTLSFIKPGRISSQGVGGMAIDSSQVFPKGSTIYGRWDSVSISADASTAGIICYFGK
mgnify:CR=1 FL=1